MLDYLKKELISTLKWTWLIIITACAFYNVAPKYEVIKENNLRINRVTGKVYEKAFTSSECSRELLEEYYKNPNFWIVDTIEHK